jgi:hypothetical protein
MAFARDLAAFRRAFRVPPALLRPAGCLTKQKHAYTNQNTGYQNQHPGI